MLDGVTAKVAGESNARLLMNGQRQDGGGPFSLKRGLN